MNPIARNRPQALAAAINAGLPQRCDRIRTSSRMVLAFMASLGCAISAGAASNIYFVNTTGDPGPTGTQSLRQAVALANAAAGIAATDNVVQFTPSLIGSTITLSNGQIPINQAMTIAGPGAGRLTISGNNTSRIFYAKGTSTSATQVTIAGLTLIQGKTTGNGGAIFALFTNLTLQDSVISFSRADFGGGILIDKGSASISGSRINGNTATYKGGGIEAYETPNLLINFSTISGNHAGNYGGGIFASASGMTLGYSLVNNNSVAYGGGTGYGGGGIALKNASSSVQVISSTITANFAAEGGGGLATLDATSSVNTSVLYSTIVENATSAGSDNGIFAAAGGSVFLQDCIIANNFSRANNDDLTGSFMSRFNLIKNLGPAALTISIGNKIGADPMLGALRDNGGPTLTMLPTTTSPVIAAGGPLGGGSSSPHPYPDQRGLPRPGSGMDMGAVERQHPEDLIFRNGFDPP